MMHADTRWFSSPFVEVVDLRVQLPNGHHFFIYYFIKFYIGFNAILLFINNSSYLFNTYKEYLIY